MSSARSLLDRGCEAELAQSTARLRRDSNCVGRKVKRRDRKGIEILNYREQVDAFREVEPRDSCPSTFNNGRSPFKREELSRLASWRYSTETRLPSSSAGFIFTSYSRSFVVCFRWPCLFCVSFHARASRLGLAP